MDVITFPENLLTTSGISVLIAWRYFTPKPNVIWYICCKYTIIIIRNGKSSKWSVSNIQIYKAHVRLLDKYKILGLPKMTALESQVKIAR